MFDHAYHWNFDLLFVSGSLNDKFEIFKLMPNSLLIGASITILVVIYISLHKQTIDNILNDVNFFIHGDTDGNECSIFF